MPDTAALYVVHLGGDGETTEPMGALDSIPLTPGLWLVRSDLTQSRLYHPVKRETGATNLFVGHLAELPKVMGWRRGLSQLCGAGALRPLGTRDGQARRSHRGTGAPASRARGHRRGQNSLPSR